MYMREYSLYCMHACVYLLAWYACMYAFYSMCIYIYTIDNVNI